jgi:hypothetical protein
MYIVFSGVISSRNYQKYICNFWMKFNPNFEGKIYYLLAGVPGVARDRINELWTFLCVSRKKILLVFLRVLSVHIIIYYAIK